MYFDAHSDLLFDVAARREQGETRILERCHLPRLRRGGAGGAMLSIWLSPSEPNPWARTLQVMDAARAELSQCPQVQPVRTGQEAEAACASGKFYTFFGVEGLDALEGDLDRLTVYRDFGCRSAMLTWNHANALAGGAAEPEPGLTAQGREVLRHLEALGMLVDVSHLNDRSFCEVAAAAHGPLIASHSNARALCPAARNLTDAQLRVIRDSGGVVGLNAYHRFVAADPQRQTVEVLAQHAAHIIDVIGIDHVGCGFDFCEFLPGDADDPRTAGLADSSEVPNFFACLRRMGLTAAEEQQLAFRNFLRVFS